jgi:YbgC/YbaW family acyl-CoA thioester hydrolase
MKPAPSPYRWETRIRFIDTDASGRIHYTCLFRYFESAEIEFLRSLGLGYDVRDNFAFPRVHVEADYFKFIGLDDLLSIEVSLGRIGRSSVQLHFHVLKSGDLVATGSVAVVCMSTTTQASMEIPGNIRSILEEAQALQQKVHA